MEASQQSTDAARRDHTKIMNRIAPTALYQEVAERLRQRIFAHELTPGTWIIARVDGTRLVLRSAALK